MAKGLAVVSGSNDVVFKALETGVITLGSAVTDAVVTLTGSLTINKHADGGDPLTITGLTQDAVSTGNNILIINASGIVREAEAIDSDNVYFTGSAETLTQFSSSVYTAIGNVSAGTTLNISASNGTGDIPLATGNLVLESADSNLEVTIIDNGSDVTASFNVADNLSVVSVSATTLTASSGLLVQGGGADITGNTTVVGTLSASSDLFSGGNLDVAGTANVGNTLTVESGGASITGDISGSGTLQIGSTSTLGGTVTVTTGDVLASNGNISASANLSAGGDLAVAGNAGIGGNLTVTGDLTILGDTTILETTNLRVEDPIIILGSSSVATTGDRGFIFQQSGGNQSFIYDSASGKYLLGSTTSDGTATDVSVTNDATLLVNTLSASLVEVSSDLNVQGNVILGDLGTDSITINGFITGSGSPIIVSSSLTIGDGTLTGDSLETTTFVSQVRMPIFSVSGVNAVAGFPTVPPDYAANPSSYNGYMFYLTSSSGFPNWNGDNDWSEGNKWYFNERGEWHESFFFNSNNFN